MKSSEKKTKFLMGMMITGSLLCMNNAANAATTSAVVSNFDLDKIVVTATRTPVEVFKTKANVSIITAEEIEKNHYSDLVEALRNIPGVQINNYGQAGHNTSNSLRINGSNKVVYLVDGIKMNQYQSSGNASGYSASMFTNLDNIERIEILKGSASTLYGADAQGGVVNIITKKPGISTDKSKIYYEFGSNGKSNYGTYLTTSNEKSNLVLNLKRSEKGNYDDGNGVDWENDEGTNNLNISYNYKFNDKSNVKFTYDLYNSNYGYTDYTYSGSIHTGNFNYGSFRTDTFKGVWNYSFDEKTHNVFSVASHKSDFKPTYFSDYYWGGVYYSGYTTYPSKTRSIHISDQISKELNDKHTLTGGFEYQADKVLEASSDWTSGIDPTGTTIKTKAVYLQDQWSITDKWNLTYGTRFTDIDGMDSKFTTSGNLGYDFNDKTNMYFSYSEFLNAPTLYQLYNGMYGNSSLSTEDGGTYEMGINHQFSDDLALTAHVFKRDTNNAINYDYTNQKYYNLDGEMTTKGYDIQLNKVLSSTMNAYIGYTFTNYDSDSDSNGILPNRVFNIGLDYEKDKWNSSLNARHYDINDTIDSYGNSYLPTTNYWVVDLATTYKANDDVKIYAKVNNLFDKYYAEMTNVTWGGSKDWYASEGRNFALGIEYSF